MNKKYKEIINVKYNILKELNSDNLINKNIKEKNYEKKYDRKSGKLCE